MLEQAVNENERRNRAVIESISQVVVMYNNTRRIVIWNKQYEDIFQYQKGFLHAFLSNGDIIRYLITHGDYGGGNGLLKQHIPHATTIDIDKSKNPDIVENILKHSKHYDLVVLRYVLHYLTDSEVLELFDVLNCTHVLVIQFVNEDLKSKYYNSVNECKYFRTNRQLKALLPNKIQTIYSKNYKVDAEFYENRLEKDWNYKAHSETLKAYYL